MHSPPTATSPDTTTRRPRRVVLGALVVALLLLAAGCNSDTEQPAAGPGEAQVVAGDDLAQAALTDLPVPDAADEAGGLNEVDGVQTQNFLVTAMSPAQLQEYYREELPPLGWTQTGATDLDPDRRSTWTMDGYTLLIAAAPQGTEETSLSLQLSEDGDTFPDQS